MNNNSSKEQISRRRDERGHSIVVVTGLVVGAVIAAVIGLLRLIKRLPQVNHRKGYYISDRETLITAAPLPSKEITTPSKPTGTKTITPDNTSNMGILSSKSTQALPTPEKMMPTPPKASTRFSTTTKYVVGIGIFLFLVFILYISRSVISMIIFAALIAFIVQPIIGSIQRRLKVGRGPAVLIAYLLVIIILLLIPLFAFPALINAINFALQIDYGAILDQIAQFTTNLSLLIESTPILGPILSPAMDSLVEASQGLSGMETPNEIQYDASLANIGTRLAKTLGMLVNILGPLVSAILSFVFMLLISVHLSLSGSSLREWYPRLIPQAYRTEIGELVDRITNIWASFLRSQLVLMVVIGVAVWLGNLVLGTPQAFFLGVIAGLLEIIPNLGPLLATIPAVLLAIFFGSNHLPINNWLFALLVILFYVLIQTLENQVLVPSILGDAVDLPPIVVIIGVIVGGTVAGILGVFLSTPVIATGREIFGYLYDKILEPPPPETPPEEKPSITEMIRGWVKRINLPHRRKNQSASK